MGKISRMFFPPQSFNKLLIILIIALVLNSLVLNIRLARLQNFITDLSIRNSQYLRNLFNKALDSVAPPAPSPDNSAPNQ